MDTLAFEHHLTSPQGHRHVPDGACTVTAGGGSCCDSVEISISLAGDLVADAGFDAHGCGAATAAGSAAVTLVRRAPVLDAARVGAREIADELGGLSPAKLHAAEVAADALARALGAALRERGELERPASGQRTLVAMSGGVDSAVAALRCAQAGETVAVTLELWADAENDAERSCCSATAVAQARSLAHSMGLPHFTIDLRREFRDGVVQPFISGYADGETPNPCVGCNGHVRLDAMLELADRLGCDTLATGHYARTAEPEHRDGPLLRVAVDAAKDQTYMLAALSPQSLARMRFPLGDLTKPEVRELAAAPVFPSPPRPTLRTCASWRGPTAAGSSRGTAGWAIGWGRSSTRKAACSGAIAASTASPSASAAGSGIASGEPLYVVDKDAQSNRVVVGPREALQSSRVTLRNARLHRDGRARRPREAPLPLAAACSARGGGGVRWQAAVADVGADRCRRRRRARPDGVPDGRRAGDRMGHDHASPPGGGAR